MTLSTNHYAFSLNGLFFFVIQLPEVGEEQVAEAMCFREESESSSNQMAFLLHVTAGTYEVFGDKCLVLWTFCCTLEQVQSSRGPYQ